MQKEIKRGYWPNGQLCYEYTYINGKEHGVRKVLYPNGQLSDEIPYKNNVRCGAKVNFEY